MSDSEQSGAGRREVAYRLFAAEYEDADLSYSEGEDDRSPNYVVTPTGGRVNRVFVVGVLTAVEQVSEDVLRGRVADPTGAFVLYAGQYQPDEQAFLERAEPPTFVAVTGKARTFQPDDSDQVYTSIRPESINEVDAATRDRWTVQAAEQTLERVGHAATALTMDASGDHLERALVEHGIDEGLAAGIVLALDHYGTTPTYLSAVRELALDAAGVVAGQRDEVTGLDVAPDESGTVTAADVADVSGGVPETGDSSSTGSTPAESGTSASSKSAGTEAVETPTTETETAETEPAEATQDEDDLGDFEPGEFELEEGTREEIEAEYGTEFQSGTEVDEPGTAEIETPEPDADTAGTEPGSEPTSAETPDAETGAETSDEDRAGGTTDEGATAGSTTESESSGESSDAEQAERPEDLQAAVVELMQELDEGSGADRESLVAEMEARYGVNEGETEDAIQQALMDGQCYEPDDTTVKPI